MKSFQNRIIIVGVFLLLLAIPLTIVITSNKTNTRSKAESIPEKPIGTAASENLSNDIRITSPSKGATVDNHVTITTDIADIASVTYVEFWKDDDKKPFSVDDSSPYEQSVVLSPGTHTLFTKAYYSVDNALVSETVDIHVSPGK